MKKLHVVFIYDAGEGWMLAEWDPVLPDIRGDRFMRRYREERAKFISEIEKAIDGKAVVVEVGQ